MTPRGSRRTPPGGGTFPKTARAGQLHEVDETSRLAYTRKQAAEALGVSISTIAGASFLPSAPCRCAADE
jgi:hypothetical protein